MSKHISLLWVLMLVLSSCRTQHVTKIVIRSIWAGAFNFKGDRLDIVCKGETCLARDQLVLAPSVTAFLEVLAAQPLPQVQLSNLGISQEWLNDNATAAVRGNRCAFTQDQKALLLTKLTDLQEVQRLLSNLLQPGITDDNPFMTIEVLRDGETVWQLESSSQSQLFMIPWVITSSKKSFATYNADVSRTLARLLPESFVNRDRIAGTHLNQALESEVATRFLGGEAWVCTLTSGELHVVERNKKGESH